MPRVRDLDQDRVDHRHVGADRHAIVEEARVLQMAIPIVDVFLAERPADALRHTALHLALDIGGMYRPADVLYRRVAQNLDVAGLRVDLDIANMRREARPLALRVDLHLGADRPSGAGRARGDGGQIERLEAAGIGTGPDHVAILPSDRVRPAL